MDAEDEAAPLLSRISVYRQLSLYSLGEWGGGSGGGGGGGKDLVSIDGSSDPKMEVEVDGGGGRHQIDWRRRSEATVVVELCDTAANFQSF